MRKVSIKQIKDKINKRYPNIDVEEYNGCVRLTGKLDSWEKVVDCGKMAVSKHFLGVLNDVSLAGYTEKPPRMPSVQDKSIDGYSPDVLIIGGGVVGCATARELSCYNLSILLVEKEDDVALAQSGRNDGCIHVGIDLSPKTNKVKYLARSNFQFEQLSQELDFKFDRCGQYVVFDKWWYLIALPLLRLRCRKNGITELNFVSKRTLKSLFPTLNPKAKFAILSPKGGVVCPYGMTIAYAENAVCNGAKIMLNTAVTSMKVENGEITAVETNRGVIHPKVVINCAGVFSDKIAQMANDRIFTIHPRKGLNCILDKKSTNHIPVTSISTYGDAKNKKKYHTKGGGVIKTVDGNILVGPNAEEVVEREDTSTEMSAVNQVIQRQNVTAPDMKYADIITYFAGVRSCTYEEDFCIYSGRNTKNIVHAGGIQSPGLSAAPAIAEDLTKFAVDIIRKKGGNVLPNVDFNPVRQGIKRVSSLPENERIELIKQNADYGEIVCRCEQISKGEIIQAVNNPLNVTSVDGIKRRVRAGMGRCQGGFCQPSVVKIISQVKKIPVEQVSKRGERKVILCDNKE